MLQNTLADVLSTIKNAERLGRKECVTRASKEIKEVLNTIGKLIEKHTKSK